MTDYVATRWYRAPELLLNLGKYTPALDMWSAGVIFGELLLRKPLFPGVDVQNQLELILELNGSPSEADLQAVASPRSREKLLRLKKRPGKAFASVFAGASQLALDLLQKMLAFNPAKRLSPEAALAHPYFQDLHVPEDEPTTLPVSWFDFEFEEQPLSVDELKALIYEEILLYHSSAKREEYARNKANAVSCKKPKKPKHARRK